MYFYHKCCKQNSGWVKVLDKCLKIVDKKKHFGDFEIDTIIGKKYKGALLTINNRYSLLVWIRKLTGKQAEPLSEKTVKTLEPFKMLIHTITGDNGKDFARPIAKQIELVSVLLTRTIPGNGELMKIQMA